MREDEARDKRAHRGPIFLEIEDKMYHPGLREFERLCREGNLIPVYREILADLETPVSAFIKLHLEREDSMGKWEDYTYLLESVERGERLGRYSFIGIDPFMIFQSKGKRAYLSSSTGNTEVYEVEMTLFLSLKRLCTGLKWSIFLTFPSSLEERLVTLDTM